MANAHNKHTPGPWIVKGGVLMTAKGSMHLLGLSEQPGLGDAAEANTLLISAAPDLLAACRAVEQAQRDGNYATAFDAVRAAIAKAQA